MIRLLSIRRLDLDKSVVLLIKIELYNVSFVRKEPGAKKFIRLVRRRFMINCKLKI